MLNKNFSDKLNDLLEKERDAFKKRNSNDIIASQLIEHRVAMVEEEKSKLSHKYEEFEKQIIVLSQEKEMKEKALEKERSDKASIEHSQEELLKKMKGLQKENDLLYVQLEGLKTENEGLINKNKNLGDRIKILEDKNKQQLQNINEALQLPAPLTLEQKSRKEKSTKDVEGIESSSAINEAMQSFTQMSSISQNLISIPTVNFSDEKRPPSLIQELKIIPSIMEPSKSENDVVKPEEHEHTSTINSQDVSTILRDSPIPSENKGKGFAETFSQSG